MAGETIMCAICLGSIETGRGQAIFTSECTHTFHFGCISSNVTHGNYLCPVCRAKWTGLPLRFPGFNRNANTLNTSTSVTNLRLHVPGSFSRFPPPPPVVHSPLFESDLEPLSFFDDESLPVNPSPVSGLQKVTIKSVPELHAYAASEPVSDFAVLVSLKAPSLPEDARDIHRAPVDLVAVLDVSTSMSGSKLSLLKRAVKFVIDSLGPSDRLSVVCFASHGQRIFPLRRMTESGRVEAMEAVNSVQANGSTNIVEGLKKGVQVLEERRARNQVSSIMFLSDGVDTCRRTSQSLQYLDPLPASIYPGNRETGDESHQEKFPVYAFGFGMDHDPLVMHSIADASGGTFSFIESYDMLQEAFASCIGGLLSVVTQELRLSVRSASNGVEIKSIPSGRYASEISNGGSQGTVKVGDLYADEEKEFLINLSVPAVVNVDPVESGEKKTALLEITCSYKDAVSNEIVEIVGDIVEIKRPDSLAPQDRTVNLEVDRQRNRLNAAESIAEAQRMAEMGNLIGAQGLLSRRRSTLRSSASGQAGDGLSMWLETEMQETENRMRSSRMYQRAGRAYALSNISSHGYQRAATRGSNVGDILESFDSEDETAESFEAEARARYRARARFNGYVTPQMALMVSRSQQVNNPVDDDDEVTSSSE